MFFYFVFWYFNSTNNLNLSYSLKGTTPQDGRCNTMCCFFNLSTPETATCHQISLTAWSPVLYSLRYIDKGILHQTTSVLYANDRDRQLNGLGLAGRCWLMHAQVSGVCFKRHIDICQGCHCLLPVYF